MRSWIIITLCTISLNLSAQTKQEFLLRTKSASLEERFDAHIELNNFYQYNRNDSALWTALEAVKIAKELNTPDKLGLAYRVAAISYADNGLYEMAIETSYQAITQYENSNLEDKASQIASCYHNLGWYNTYLEDHSRTAELFHIGLSYKPLRDRSDSINHTVSYHALGSFYQIYTDQLDSGYYYMKKTYDWRSKLGYDIEILAQTDAELSEVLIRMKNFEKAQEVLDRMKNYPVDSTSEYVQNYILWLDALWSHHHGEFLKALELMMPVYDWGESNDLFYSSTGINFLRQLTATADSAKAYSRAYEYLRLLREVEKETIFKDRQRATKALEIRHETERKEQMISFQETQLSQQQKAIVTIGVILVLILGLCFLLYRLYQQVKKKNQQIETLMRELHHRVKNNLQVISSLLGLQSMRLEDSAAKKAVAEGKERIRAMSLIHQKLYQRDEVTSLNIKDYIENLVEELSQSYGAKNTKIDMDIPSIELDADTSLPIGLIINELVSNAFKYAYEDCEEPILELRLIQQSNNYELFIRDNGSGISPTFNIENAKSFGLKLVNLLVKQLKGNINWESDNGLSYTIAFSKT